MKILTGVSLDSKIVYNYFFTFLSLFSNLHTIIIYYFVNKNVWNKNTGVKFLSEYYVKYSGIFGKISKREKNLS